MDDEDREDMIDIKRLEYIGAPTPEKRREVYAQLRELINGRSKAQVERMERERGLR